MRKILAAIALILISSHGIMAEIITKEDKKAFNSCVLLGQCWTGEKPDGGFFKHPRVINALQAILTPAQYQQLLVKQIFQTRPYHCGHELTDINNYRQELTNLEMKDRFPPTVNRWGYRQELTDIDLKDRFQQTVHIWGFCQLGSVTDTKLETCDHMLIASFQWAPPWKIGTRVRISEEALYNLMMGANGKGGKIQFLFFTKTASLQEGQARFKPVFYWQDGMDQPADLTKDAGVFPQGTQDCSHITNPVEKSFETVLSCLQILGEKFTVPQ